VYHNKTSRLLEFKAQRAALRQELLADAITGSDKPLVFNASFDGYGDSGQFNNDTENDAVNDLLSEAIDLFVTFDWYNNEGGGGDIFWDVRADKILINGYYNVTERVDAVTDLEV
jgi:hypothetical protein